MSFLSRLFGSGSSKGPGDIEAQLARLEAEAAEARAGYVGTSYNKAGDLALKEGQSDRAVGYYGRAIDAFLEDAQREAARGVANKIIRVRPAAVRTLCTLTWLDLAAQHQATALLHLRDYVESAKKAGQQARAATQIYEMAKIVPNSEFIEAAADALDGLDFSNRGVEVRGWAGEQRPEALSDGEELAEACLVAAVRSSDRDAVLLRDRVEFQSDDSEVQADDSEVQADDSEGKVAGRDEAASSESELSEESGEPDDRDSSSGKKYRWD